MWLGVIAQFAFHGTTLKSLVIVKSLQILSASWLSRGGLGMREDPTGRVLVVSDPQTDSSGEATRFRLELCQPPQASGPQRIDPHCLLAP
jgi:hypothetical protein